MNKLSKKGFTLIELLVVTAIIGILAIVSATIFSSILRSQNKIGIINEVRQNGNIVIDKFDRDVKQSISITPPGVSTKIIMNTHDSGTVEWECVGGAALTITRNTENVINVDSIGGVQLVPGRCEFNVSGPSRTQIVKFDFDLEQRTDITGKSELTTRVPFEVTIGTR